jgi:hypothetical protein
MKTMSPRSVKITKKTYIIGRRGFAKISAVEGIHLSEAMDEDFREFDRKGLSPEDRRRQIYKKYAKVR